MEYYIGVDLGTTAVKVVLFDASGKPVCEESEEVGLIYGTGGMIRQKPECWYEIPCSLIKKVSSGIRCEQIKAIGISSQGISVVPVGNDGKPLTDGISWLDTSAEKELGEILSVIPENELFDITGIHPSALYTLPKLVWLKKNMPEVFENSAKFLMPLDYLTFRLTGNAVTDATMAGGTMLFDLHSGKWSKKLCDTFGIPESKFPVILPTTSFAGYINEETMTLTGLTGGTAVAVGAQDQKIAAYGIGTGGGTATVSLGTAGAIEAVCTEKSNLLPSFRFETSEASAYMVEGCVNTFGAAIKWLKNTLFPQLSYREMDDLAEAAPAGCRGVCFFPHLSGSGTSHYGDSISSGWRNITLATTRSELIRSLYEGLACEIKLNADAASAAGANIGMLTVFGGAGKSKIVCQTISDVTGLEVCSLDFPELSSFGAAKSAFVCRNREIKHNEYSGFSIDTGCKFYHPNKEYGSIIFSQYMNSAENSQEKIK